MRYILNMLNKFKLIIILNFLIVELIYAQYSLKRPVINKIIYRQELIDLNQPVIINIYLNPMKAIDVNVFLNDKEINNLNKNLKPFDNNYNNFYPLISFEIANLNEENILRIFVTLSEGLVVDAIEKIKFYKATIVDEKNNKIENSDFFYAKVGENKEGVFYDVKFNRNIIRKIEDVFYNNIIYSRFEVIKKGTTNFAIYQFEEKDFLLNQDIYNTTPIKEFNITIE